MATDREWQTARRSTLQQTGARCHFRVGGRRGINRVGHRDSRRTSSGVKSDDSTIAEEVVQLDLTLPAQG